MRRTISQILILAIFLFLAAFSSVWFKDDSEKPESFSWVQGTAGKAMILLDGLVRFASPASNSYSAGIRSGVENISQEAGDFVSDELAPGAADSALGAIESNGLETAVTVPEGGFNGFVSDVLTEAPERYLDAKLYNRGLKEFFSFYWLKFKDLGSE